MGPRELEALARTAIAACDGRLLTARWCATRAGDEPTWLFGAGKAAVAMAQGVVDAGVPLVGGVVVGKRGLESPSRDWPAKVERLEAAHPVPDASSARAASIVMTRLAQVPPEHRVLFVLSGGASALLCAPAAGLAMSEIERATEILLGAGLPIGDINEVRRRLMCAAAGGLARACVARVDVLVLSDALGDDLAVVGSGPFVVPSEGEDRERRARACAIAGEAGLSRAVIAALDRDLGLRMTGVGPTGATQTCSPIKHHVVGSHATLMSAALATCGDHYGELQTIDAWDCDVGACAEHYTRMLADLGPGALCISGGEPTVELPEEPGCGGRNQHLALLLAKQLAIAEVGREVVFAAVGSDGDDGVTDAAGAVIDGHTWSAIERAGLDPDRALRAADAYPVLDAVDALVRLGATGTNVLDLHLLSHHPGT